MIMMREVMTDCGYGALVSAVEEHVPCEIRCHFFGMTSYRLLRDGNEASSSSVLRVNKRLRSFVFGGDVRIENCASRVLSCIKCQALTGYCVLWVKSSVSVVVADSLVSSSEGSRRRNSCAAKKECEQHNITFLTLHIVDLTAGRDPLKHSFALQSVCQPGRVLHLECYPHHMIHFGLLMYILWQCPDENFRTLQELRPCRGKSTCSSTCTSITDVTTTTSGTTTFSFLPLPLFTSPKDTSVLILGLGGNVIGNCLDAALPVDVPIDIVEVEPAVLETCRQHGQVPPCDKVETQKEDQAAHVWVVRCGQQRFPHYRFIIGDARKVLQEGNKGNGDNNVFYSRHYGLIFLDCYDPAGEHMMHDGDLVDLCRSRLSPGGALIINAHILPIREALEEQFLSRGFSSVQVLRVAGCDQSIIVCLAGSVALVDLNGGGRYEQQHQQQVEWGNKRLDRFCVRYARQMARFIHEVSDAIPDVCLFRSGFSLDAKWLKTSRSLEGVTCPTRVWEHYD